MRPSKEQRAKFEHWNYAHRGLHTKDKKVPENSLAAFRRAAEAGYGAELDVQFSKDKQVVVFHDDTLDRVTGVHGRVDAFTYEELKAMSLCGSDQHIPLFTEVLDTFGKGKGPLIVEFKTGPHNDELCEKTLEILRTYKRDFCIESFDPRIVLWFKKNAPDIVRGQLATGSRNYKDQKGLLPFALSRCLINVVSRPHFIAYDDSVRRPLTVHLSRLFGTMLVAWTSRVPDADQPKNDAVIFEFYQPSTRF